MTLKRKGKYWYGDDTADLRAEVMRYSGLNEYAATRFGVPVCTCGGERFHLRSDEEAGVVERTCADCGATQWMGDSAEFAENAELDSHACVCDAEADVFELAPAVHLYVDSNDVRWFYVGCRCPACGLVGVYVDYKCKGGDADAFLANC